MLDGLSGVLNDLTSYLKKMDEEGVKVRLAVTDTFWYGLIGTVLVIAAVALIVPTIKKNI